MAFVGKGCKESFSIFNNVIERNELIFDFLVLVADLGFYNL